MGHNHVVSGNPKSTGIPEVNRLSTGPPDLGCHTSSIRDFSDLFLDKFVTSWLNFIT